VKPNNNVTFKEELITWMIQK